MNADALIGMELGTCTLQKILGQGGMGAVYLAQQTRPRRQVAVKVLLPTVALTPHQQAAFLERFRRETDAAASLEHPNILPVYEYGERNGLAYLVVPYVSGGTLRDIMEQQPQLPLAQILYYLDQLAAALDFAHERGVIHRDIKPANILMMPNGRLLLTDFGLVKIVSDGRSEYSRITGAGAPIGTPDYMAPEQVIGNTVDGRADLYSVGVVIYQMVTGRTPFQGQTPMHVAAQHLQSPPPAPRLFRPDLPLAVEQIILRAMEKQPGRRFANIQECAGAFRMALEASNEPGIAWSGLSGGMPALDTPAKVKSFKPGGLFDPSWQTGGIHKLASPTAGSQAVQATGAPNTNVLRPVAQVAQAAQANPPHAGGLLSRTGMFPKVGETGQLANLASNNHPPSIPHINLPTSTEGRLPGARPMVALPPDSAQNTNAGRLAPPAPVVMQAQPPMGAGQLPFSQPQHTTAGMKVLDQEQRQHTGNTMKLTGPARVVQVPVVGQPGVYVTGLLPGTPTTQGLPTPQHEQDTKGKTQKRRIRALVTFAVVLLLLGSGLLLFRNRLDQFAHLPGNTAKTVAGTPDLQATTTAQAQATVEANIILSDPLNQNIHNWPVNGDEFFSGNAYHIFNNQSSGGLAVILAQNSFTSPNAFSLTMWEVKGNDNSPNNSFGMILRFSQGTKSNKPVTTFYSFEVVNQKGGEYRFYKYDNSQGTPDKYWTQIWQQPFGHEFHEGQGASNSNTISIGQNGNHFSFIVNGKTVGSITDNSFKSGTVGMFVNLKGTEVAFSNMLIAHH